MGTNAVRPKYKGYAALSKYQDTDIELGLIRRFGHLHFRNLLYYQDELAELEEHLERLDLRHDLQAEKYGSRRRDKNPARAGLMGQIRTKLQAFDEALLATSEVLRLQRPTPVQSEALKTFITQTRPLVKDEEVFIQKERDWVALHTPEEPYPLWVKEFLEHHSWSKLFQSSHQKAYFDQLNIETQGVEVLFTKEIRVRRFMRIVVTFSGCLLLLVPIILLYLLHSDVAKLVIIVTTVLLFTTVTSAITAAKSWEVVAASIAYAAVLVVFVTSGVGQSSGKTEQAYAYHRQTETSYQL